MEELISVIIPIYNIEEYVSRCVESVLRQSYKNIEIILIDDGSTDSSGQLCDEYEAQDERIVVVHKSNGGLSDARNVGIDIATGKYLVFVDGDDWISERHIELLYADLISSSADISICSCSISYDGNNAFTHPQKKIHFVMGSEETIEKMLFSRYFSVSAPFKLYKRVLFNGIRFPVGKLYEDMYTTYKVVQKAERIVFSNDNTYSYFQRVGSITSQKLGKKQFELFDAIQEIQDQYKNNKNILKAIKHQKLVACMGLLCNCAFEQKEEKDELWKYVKQNRWAVLFDKNTIIRIRAFCILSYMGKNITILTLRWYYGRK